MKRITTLSLAVLFALLLTQCAPKVHHAVTATSPNTAASTTASAPSSDRVAALKAKYSEVQMAEGKTIMESKCHSCHPQKAVESRTAEQWDRILDRMIPKAHLDEDAGGKVRAYILTHAKMG